MAEAEKPTLQGFSDLVGLQPLERLKAELKILDALMAQAARDKEWGHVLKLFQEAHSLLTRSKVS